MFLNSSNDQKHAFQIKLHTFHKINYYAFLDKTQALHCLQKDGKANFKECQKIKKSQL